MSDFKLIIPPERALTPCLVVGPGLEVLEWCLTTSRATMMFSTRQDLLFTCPDDFAREDHPMPRPTLRRLIVMLFGAPALLDPPYLDEVWEACRHSIEFNAPGTVYHETCPSQWDKTDYGGQSGVANPDAPARVLRYGRKLRHKGLYVDPVAAATFKGPNQAVELLKVLVANYGDGRVISDETIVNTVRHFARTAHQRSSPFRTRQSPEVVYRYYRKRYLLHGALRIVGAPIVGNK